MRLSLEALEQHSLTLPDTKRGFDTWDHAEQFMLEGFNEQLNRIIDGCVAAIFLRVVRKPILIKMTRRARSDMLAYLEREFTFSGQDLPGWAAVDAVTRDANATKHRNGFHWESTPTGIARHIGTVSLYPEDVSRRSRGTKRWLKALGAATRME